jgi:SAM-dependent methyltransferase
LGCGEGLYIPILQEFFKEHEVKAQVRIVGVDRDPAAIATAKEYTATLGFRNARFYVHDLTKPLTQIEGLDLTRPENHFDLAYALVTLMHLKDVSRTLGYILEVLKPGGAFYTKDVSITSSLNYPSPALTKLGSMMGQLMLKMVGGDFALHHQEFLKATGFEQIETFESHYVLGGRTPTGRRTLDDILLSQHAFRASALNLGLMSASDYDKLMQQEFQEITPDLEGQVTSINTIARRPLT